MKCYYCPKTAYTEKHGIPMCEQHLKQIQPPKEKEESRRDTIRCSEEESAIRFGFNF